jgi:hypothetical protein
MSETGFPPRVLRQYCNLTMPMRGMQGFADNFLAEFEVPVLGAKTG